MRKKNKWKKILRRTSTRRARLLYKLKTIKENCRELRVCCAVFFNFFFYSSHTQFTNYFSLSYTHYGTAQQAVATTTRCTLRGNYYAKTPRIPSRPNKPSPRSIYVSLSLSLFLQFFHSRTPYCPWHWTRFVHFPFTPYFYTVYYCSSVHCVCACVLDTCTMHMHTTTQPRNKIKRLPGSCVHRLNPVRNAVLRTNQPVGMRSRPLHHRRTNRVRFRIPSHYVSTSGCFTIANIMY